MQGPGAGLCGASLHVWYKAASQELLQQWTGHAAAVVALHKGRQRPLQQEAVQTALEQFKECSKAFSCLLHLNKTHLKRIQVCRPCRRHACTACQCLWVGFTSLTGQVQQLKQVGVG